jgi:hypothetical protein
MFVYVEESIQCSGTGVHIGRLGEHRTLKFVISFPSFPLASLAGSQYDVYFAFINRDVG